MSDSSGQQRSGAVRLKLCWIALSIWLAAAVTTAIWPNPIGEAFALLLPVIVLVHGSILYGWVGICVYLAVGFTVGFAFEAFSIAYGFPFGHFVHNGDGFKVAGVAPMALVAYALLGWFAWTIAHIITLDRPFQTHPIARLTLPLVGAFVLAGVDLPTDPIVGTIEKKFTYTYPSGQFGVPLTNYLGWIVTGWVMFQIFVLIQHRFPRATASRSRAFWLLPCLTWLSMIVHLPGRWLRTEPGMVSVGGRSFVIADIYEAAVITSLFSVVAVIVFAVARLYSRPGGWDSADG